MSIPNCILTKKGQALLAKTPSGAEIPVTRGRWAPGCWLRSWLWRI